MTKINNAHVDSDDNRPCLAQDRKVVQLHPAVESARLWAPRRGVGEVPYVVKVIGAEVSVRFVRPQFLDQEQRLVRVPTLPRAGGVSDNLNYLKLFGF